MNVRNEAMIKIVEAMNLAGYVVESIEPERRRDGLGNVEVQSTSRVIVTLVTVD